MAKAKIKLLSEKWEEKMLKVALVAKATGLCYSLEAGLCDGEKNFDHHGKFAGQPAPCSDNRLDEPIFGDFVVEISHIDADTFIGLLRMAGQKLPRVDFALMEQIDLNGSSVVRDKFDPTLLYMVGIGELARQLRFPRPDANGPTDVSALVEAMMTKMEEEIIEIGRDATKRSEAAYRNCVKSLRGDGKVGMWSVGANDPLDPSRPYEDGTEVVVVFRSHYQSISVYCSPKSSFGFGGQTVAGITFAGHPKAAGSPRGVPFTETDARRVFNELLETVI
jgi:hypothetical protein